MGLVEVLGNFVGRRREAPTFWDDPMNHYIGLALRERKSIVSISALTEETERQIGPDRDKQYRIVAAKRYDIRFGVAHRVLDAVVNLEQLGLVSSSEDTGYELTEEGRLTVEVSDRIAQASSFISKAGRRLVIASL